MSFACGHGKEWERRQPTLCRVGNRHGQTHCTRGSLAWPCHVYLMRLPFILYERPTLGSLLDACIQRGYAMASPPSNYCYQPWQRECVQREIAPDCLTQKLSLSFTLNMKRDFRSCGKLFGLGYNPARDSRRRTAGCAGCGMNYD